MLNVVEDDNVRITRLELGIFQTNCYIATCKATGDSMLVDAPSETDRILQKLRDTTTRYIVLTHGHEDHIEGLAELKSSLGVPLAAHPFDSIALPVPADIDLKDGQVITVGRLSITCLHTPGHTAGSVCFLLGRYLCSGDTIFPGGPGHTDSPASFKQILESIKTRILPLSDDTMILPGHGEPTTLKAERESITAYYSRPHASDQYGDVVWLPPAA